MINKKDITEIDWSVIIPLMPTVTNTTNGLYPASNFKNLPKIIGITDSTVLIKIATLTKSYEYIRLKVIDVSNGLIGEVNISVSTDAYGALSQITKKVLYGNLKFYINRNDGSIYVEKVKSNYILFMTLNTNLKDYTPEAVEYNIEGLEEVQ